MRQYIFSIAAFSIKTYEVVQTVGITSGHNVLEAESSALRFAEKRWPFFLGWGQHSASVLEVESTKKVVREDEETMGITFQVNE